MEVKPVGRERNRQIAELRGYKHYKGNDIPDYAREVQSPPDQEVWAKDSDNFYCNLCGTLPNYSTSLTDAWPLWEEMKESALRPSLITVFKDATLMAVIAIGIGKFEGVDEPDAISGVWVKWMVGKDG